MLIPFTPPPDYLPQFLTGFVALTISFFTLLELADDLTKRPVFTTLFPIALIIFAHMVLINVSYFAWYDGYNYAQLRQMIFAQAATRLMYNTLDATIYAQRSVSIFMFHRWWMQVALVFLMIRWILQTVLLCMDVAYLYKADTFDKFLHLAFSAFASVNTTSQLVVPMLQAMILDGSMLYFIVHMLRSTGRRIHTSRKRIVRIVLLILTCAVFLIMKLVSEGRSRANASLASGGIVIIIALGGYVNIDLYNLDIALFKVEASGTEFA